MALRVDLEFIGGDDTQLGLVVRHDDGTPFDLTGKRIELMVKPLSTSPDGDAIFTLSTVSGAPPRITVTSVAGGIGVADLTNLLGTAGSFWFEAWVADVTDPKLDKETWAYGFMARRVRFRGAMPGLMDRRRGGHLPVQRVGLLSSR